MPHYLERTHGDRSTEPMDRHMPGWRSRRDLLNDAPLGHEGWALDHDECRGHTTDGALCQQRPDIRLLALDSASISSAHLRSACSFPGVASR